MRGASSESFTLTANEDADSDDETVSVSFGTLPAGVVSVGTPRQATVRLLDNDGIVPKPLAVRALTSRSTGQTSGQASWKAPSNALAAKVYSYRYRLDGGTIQTTTSTSASFSSLQPGSRYSVDVWAVGPSGAGKSTTTTFITDDSGKAPVLASVGPLDCYVGEYCSFTFPVAEKGTAPITYTVSPPSWATASGRSFSGTAPSSPGTASASLNASNAYGTDSESLTITIKRWTVVGVAPVLPSVSSITCYVGEYCSFTFPAARKGTAPITYAVAVRAVNTGGASDAAWGLATPGRLFAPDGLQAVAGDGWVVLRWSAAGTEGPVLTRYEWRGRPVWGAWSAWEPVAGGAAARGHKIEGLTNGVECVFEVRAANPAGAGVVAQVVAEPAPEESPPL
ncbi:MAG: fibronectin type III domain-containing protein [Gemmatimonadetes bacterium]|nr:fibronectin type III domain-containing protein [Gemmatimonadota bacterium]